MDCSFDAALTWTDPALAFLSEEERGLRRRVTLEERGDGFGLLEPETHGWTLCIPAGADVEACLGEAPIDLDTLSLEPSGERRLPLCAGLRAKVTMGEFRFEIRPAA
jgi:hypothetical protein